MRLDVPHRRQPCPAALCSTQGGGGDRRQGECLAACAAMVLTYWGERVDDERLVRRLDTSNAGAFFFNLDHLRSWRFVVERAQGNLELLQLQLEVGHPIIVPVDTGLLPYWITRTEITEIETTQRYLQMTPE